MAWIFKQGEPYRDKMAKLYNSVGKAVELASIEIKIVEITKSREQEKKYHAMIADIAKQVTFDGSKRFSNEVWKARLVEQFAQEREEMGEPLRHGAQTVMSLDLKRVITVRPSTQKLGVKEAADFIEYLYSVGAEMGVVWSDPTIKQYENYKEAQ